jgi:DNA polymerase-3 subunit delta'
MFAEADEYNLDPRQTLVAIFDAIRKHSLLTASPIEPR